MGAVIAAGLALVISGCASTQTTAARLQLNNTRLRAVADTVRIKSGGTSRTVTVSAKTILSSRGSFTGVVTLENHSATAVSDLPISVGYRVGARTVYLNGAAGLSYFDNHIPSIPAHGSLTWVDTGKGAKLPRRAQTFARVGNTPTSELGSFTPPTIGVTPMTTVSSGKLTILTVHLTNASSIPQYQLPVYAVVNEGSKILAARDTSITELAGGAKAVVRVVLPSAGTSTEHNSIRVEAPATIFK